MKNTGRAQEQRTFSERVLDKYLRKFEKDAFLEKQEKKYQNSPKKIKTEVEVKNNNVSNINVTPHEALDKLLKHLENPQKATKSVNLILQLIKTNVKTIHYLHLFETAYQITKFKNHFKEQTARQAILQIMESMSLQEIKEKFKKKEQKLFDIMVKNAEFSCSLNTDDSYQFHSGVKKLIEYFNETYQEFLKFEGDSEEDSNDDEETQNNNTTKNEKEVILNKIKNKLSKKDSEPKEINEEQKEKETILYNYEYNLSEQLTNLLKNKREIFDFKVNLIHGIILECNKLYSKEWAKSSINMLINTVFYHKDIFNETQIEMINNIMKEINLKRQKHLNKDLLRNNLDEKILANPLISKNEVKDGRATVFTDDGLGKWSSRQCGL